MADDIEVWIDFAGGLKRTGTLRRHARRGGEATSFQYDAAWLTDQTRFSLEPALSLHRGSFAPPAGQRIFGSIGDSAPDTWGRRLMQRAERRQAALEGRAVNTLMEADYLLGVADISRLGALRFKHPGGVQFLSRLGSGVPAQTELQHLLQITGRIQRDEETDDDLRLIFAPGSSLGGARPKASVTDRHGQLAIAKFPKDTDDYSIETWESVALRLAARAGLRVAPHELVEVAGRRVLLSKRFDRESGARVPFLSALSMLGVSDGVRASYPEIADSLARYGAQAAVDARELFARMVFNVLVSNVDDHLRNHGFLWTGRGGWALSPAYDLNPVPADARPRILTTSISLDDATCDIDLVLSVAGFFGLSDKAGREIVRRVAQATATWRAVAEEVATRRSEIARMESAFEHGDLAKALAC